MDHPSKTEFERLNYFKGMFTAADDWKLEQRYHRMKLLFENRVLRNMPGIVQGYRDDLAVGPDDRKPPDGSSSRVVVQPGAAVDPAGNLLYLDEAAQVDLPTDQVPSGESTAVFYVTIKYGELERRYFLHPNQPEYSGFTRILERPELHASTAQPGEDELELARVEFKPGKGIHRIDRSHVQWSPTMAQEDARLDEHDRRLSKEEQKSAGVERELARLEDLSRLLHRGLHTPGIVHAELGEFRVDPAGGLNVTVHAGAALDGHGNTIICYDTVQLPIPPVAGERPEWVFIVVRHGDGRPTATRTRPDNHTALELARIDLYPGATEVEEPADPDNPGPNQVNRCERPAAGAVGIVERQMSPQLLQRVIQAMEPTRRSFVALDDRFPTPSAGDVRYSALTVSTLARIGCLRPGQLPGLMATLADIQQDVGSEIHQKYGNIVNGADEFIGYRDAVARLMAALRLGGEDDILNAQNALASAAYVLARMAVENPIADGGADQTIPTFEKEVTVRLDAHLSQGRGGRIIKEYRWDHVG